MDKPFDELKIDKSEFIHWWVFEKLEN